MAHDAVTPSGFLLCPPLDLPMRLRGHWGGPKLDGGLGESAAECASDRFASVHHSGLASRHRIHEAVDLESGEGCCVFAAYSGEIAEVNPQNLLITHHIGDAAFATRYMHVIPGPKGVGRTVGKGEAIATVAHNDAGDHLHFELWHWIDPDASPDTDSGAVPIDPTRMLSRWEVEHALDYAVLGTIDAGVAEALDDGLWSAPLVAAYRSSRIRALQTPSVEVLAAGAVWRLTDGTAAHLLRLEGPSITIFDEAYGTRTVHVGHLDEVAVVRRRSHPTVVVTAEGIVYGIPLHDATASDRHLVDLLHAAFDAGGDTNVTLQVRRSPFWGMDGSVDEVSAVIEGVRLRRG